MSDFLEDNEDEMEFENKGLESKELTPIEEELKIKEQSPDQK